MSALRAYERYGPPAVLNVLLRIAVVISAVVVAAFGGGVRDIMIATLFWSVLVLVCQGIATRTVVGRFNPLPTLRIGSLREVFGFGCFSWLQALAGVTFSYADRFVVGALLGTAPLAIYVICVQAAQPIHGLTAAGFNFLFPHLSSRYESGEIHGPRRVFKIALLANLVIATVCSLPFVLFARPILRLWMGPQFAEQGHLVLTILAISYAALAINVVPHNSLLATGRVRTVAVLHITSGFILLGSMWVLISRLGLAVGAALSRVALYDIARHRLFRLRARRCSCEKIEFADVV